MNRLVVIAIAACTPLTPPPTTTPVVAAPPPAEIPPVAIFAPAGEPLRYGDLLPRPVTTAFDDAVIAATKTTPDPRLFRVCASLAAFHDHVEPAAIELAWSWYGVIEVPPKPIVIRTDDPKLAIAALGAVPPGSHIGIGHADGTVVLVVTTPRVVIAPFSRSAPIEGGFAIDAKLDLAVTDPELQVEWNDASVQRSEPTMHGRSFAAKIGCQNRPGLGRVSIIGHVASKPLVLGRFSVWCGTEPPRTVSIDPLHQTGDDRDPDRSARRLFTMLQRERVAAGLPQLAWDDSSAATARQHADDMRANLATGATGRQFHGSQIAAASIVEHIAVGSTVDDAYTKLMTNPQRRADVMSPKVTTTGIGVAIGDDGQLYVAQIFLRTPPTIVPEVVASDLENRIHAANNHIVVDEQLTEAAGDVADALKRRASDREVNNILNGAQQRMLYKLDVSIIETVDLASVDPIKLVTIPKTNHIGIAVVQGHHPKLGDNAIWIVIMMSRSGS